MLHITLTLLAPSLRRFCSRRTVARSSTAHDLKALGSVAGKGNCRHSKGVSAPDLVPILGIDRCHVRVQRPYSKAFSASIRPWDPWLETRRRDINTLRPGQPAACRYPAFPRHIPPRSPARLPPRHRRNHRLQFPSLPPRPMTLDSCISHQVGTRDLLHPAPPNDPQEPPPFRPALYAPSGAPRGQGATPFGAHPWCTRRGARRGEGGDLRPARPARHLGHCAILSLGGRAARLAGRWGARRRSSARRTPHRGGESCPSSFSNRSSAWLPPLPLP